MYDYLEHHGIKGQRWGVRRYQNPDGTRTNAGKARYSSGGGLSKVGNKLKNMSPKEKALLVGGALATISIVQSAKNAKAAAALLSEMNLNLRMSEVVGKTAFQAGKMFAIGAGATMLVQGAKTARTANKQKKSASDKYIDAFDKKAATYQDRADRKRIEGKQSKQIFEKAAQRREAHVKTTLEDKARAERLTRNISDDNKLKKTYLKGFDSKAARYQDRTDRKRAEGEQSEKIFEKAAQRREAHVKTTLEDKERAKKLLKKK